MTAPNPWVVSPWTADDLDEQTVDELVELAVEYDERTDGMFDELAAIRSTVVDEKTGITLTSTIDGMLVKLELSEKAIELGAATLAAEIFRLSQQAAAQALNRGIAVLAPVVGIEVATALTVSAGLDEYTTDDDKPAEQAQPAAKKSQRPPRPPVLEEDFSTIETWAVS